jgi:hypothetical protein
MLDLMMSTLNRARDWPQDRRQDRRIDWRRELAPVLMVAGLAADYLSPPEAWTILLPVAFILVLAAMRKWVYAAAVFLLCSWVLVPTTARAVAAVEDLRDDHILFVTPGATMPPAEALTDPRVLSHVRFEELPVGPGYLIEPRWALRGVVVTFVDVHNLMVVEQLLDSGDQN